VADKFRVLLREIADKTGISRMAVSLALRGKSVVFIPIYFSSEAQ